MRRGAGPSISVPDINSHSSGMVNDVGTVAAQMKTLSTKDGDGGCGWVATFAMMLLLL